MPYHSGKSLQDEESILADADELKENMLSLSEAEKRVAVAVAYLQEEINRIDETPGKQDEDRDAYLSEIFLSLLAEERGITPDK